jgi:hypothetical protein
MGKGKGDKSGVTATDIVKRDDIGALTPGKATVVDTNTGDDWLDNGIDPKALLYDKEKRERIVDDFEMLALMSNMNYKLALTDLRFEELAKEADDIPIILTFAIGMLTQFVSDAVTKAIIRARAGTLTAIADRAFALGEVAARDARLEKALKLVSDDTIKGYVKKVGGVASKAGEGAARDATTPVAKGVVVGFIDQLRNSADAGYAEFIRDSKRTASDADLIVLWNGMDTQNHNVDAFKRELKDKIDRFKKSGITKLGRGRGAKNDIGVQDGDLIEDRRVVWVQHANGTKTLCYQQHKSSDNPNTIRRGEPGFGEVYPDHKPAFGELDKAEKAKLDGVVPEEFVTYAIAVSEERWGQTPTIEDPMNVHSKVANNYRARMDAARLQKPATPSSPVRTDVRGYGAWDMMSDFDGTVKDSK